MSMRDEKFARRLFKTIIPKFLREAVILQDVKKMLAGHNEIYSSAYFNRDVEQAAVHSAPDITMSLIRDFAPRSVIDVGCGTGALLEAIRDRGVDVFGLEYADAALEFCRQRKLNVRKFDLETRSGDVKERFSVAISMEVAEHLPARVAEHYVGLLTTLAPVIVFTAAPPGQGGVDHVNEQPAEYWIAKFAARGYVLLPLITEKWKDEWRKSGNVAFWYYKNLLVFKCSTP